MAPVLGTYVDYRKFLHDFYNDKRLCTKDLLRPYSYSDFSAAANIKSPNYLKLIIEGKRNLSTEMCKKFGKALRLDKGDIQEFTALVKYNQALEPLERNQYLKSLSELRAKKDMASGKINSGAWDKVPGWLSWVIYSMTDLGDISFDTQNLRTLLQDRATEGQIDKALSKLKEEGEIQVSEDGKVSRSQKIIRDADQVSAALIRKLQAELVYLGLESLHRDSPTERELSGFTLAMTEKEYEWVRYELRKMRKNIQKTIQANRESSPGERIYQVNIQLFPITKKVEKNKKKSSEDCSV